MRILSPGQMRAAELRSEKIGVSRGQLMENAGNALAEIIRKRCTEKINAAPEKISVVFLAGSGNNGGDCFVAARRLSQLGYSVTVVNLCSKPHTELARNAFKNLAGTGVRAIKAFRGQNMKSRIEAAELDFMTLPRDNDLSELVDSPQPSALEKIQLEEENRIRQVTEALAKADIIADGVFGTGFHGQLDSEIIGFLNAEAHGYKIAVDVPSGGNCASGDVAEGTFHADETVVFGAVKIGMTQYPLKEFCGRLRLADIGIPEEAFTEESEERVYRLVDNEELTGFPRSRKGDSHKGNFGRVLCITGSTSMRGAAVLSLLGALRSGVGIAVLASVEKTVDTAAVLAPEAMFRELECDDYGYMLCEYNTALLRSEIEKADAVLTGCGMGVTADTCALTKFVIENTNCPLIIDADGINCIASDIDILLKKKTDIILTPHVGEMARLTGKTTAEISSDRFSAAAELAEKYGVTVVLKGAGTIIADSTRTSVIDTGNSGMSRGGSGDVLAGITASLAAQGYTPYDAARYAAYTHGLAGDIAADKLGYEAMLSRDIIDALSDSFGMIKSSQNRKRNA
ncbi:MAG: NAD(P)H-hydrate dehydratase [Ruminococcus sp.]|nr:NAD(P)H-hydrate dehydratase [Ruminococcus sp.]